MGKKTKIGKQRRDKYYKLAKEAGYRSRAAFKLIQLNKRFEFLQNSRATVDLCAAPGGWMQVAVQNMPVSSLVIGVDLAPIKPIPHTIALQGDITTESTRQAIKKEMNNWSADCVLHDGAPNVGLNWVHDAFQQNCLVLSALKLTTQILRKGGTFVTKVFRSNDYSCLITVFEKLFKKVHVWKPAASRLESAEIFVVCEKYSCPAKVPSELLDPKKVFSEPDGSEPTKANPQTLLLSKKKERKAKADGYDDAGLKVFKSIEATQFIQSHDYLEMLGEANEIVLDQEKWKQSEATTEEVKECIKDLKVCGPRELRTILKWRKSMRKILEDELHELEKEEADEVVEVEKVLDPDEIEDRELAEIDEMIAKASEEEKAALKKKKKRMLRAKAKVIKRKQLKMIIEGDTPDIANDDEIFSLRKIRRARELAALRDSSPEHDAKENSSDDEDEDDSGLGDGEWETRERDSDDEEDNDLIHTEETGLTEDEKKKSRADAWFEREEISAMLSDDDDEEVQIQAVEKHISKSKAKYDNTVTFDDEDEKKKSKKRKMDDDDNGFEIVAGSSGSDSEVEDDAKETPASKFDGGEMNWEEVDDEPEDNRATKRQMTKTILGEDLKPKAKKQKLTPEELAMGEQMIYSSKSARELEEWGWHKYANNDEGLPDWFVEDEKKHYFKTPPVTKEQVRMYRERMRELNARPCKKVADAKARKQRRARQKMERAKKRAEGVLANENLEHAEKVREMKKIYSQATKDDRKKTEVVRVTKGKKGRLGRPGGKYKLVDNRMKKDLRAAKAKEKTKGRRGHGSAGGGRGRGKTGRR